MQQMKRDTDGAIQKVLKFLSVWESVDFLKSKFLIFRLTCDKNAPSHRWRPPKSIEIPIDFEDD